MSETKRRVQATTIPEDNDPNEEDDEIEQDPPFYGPYLSRAIPSIIVTFCLIFNDTISIFFIRKIKSLQAMETALGFSFGWLELVGFALFSAFSFGYGTQCTRLVKSGKIDKVQELTLKTMSTVFFLLVAVCLIVLFLTIEASLFAEGIEILSTQLLRNLLPCVAATAYFQIFRFYLVSFERYWFVAFISIISTVGLYYGLPFAYEFYECPLAAVTNMRNYIAIAQLIITFIYLKLKNDNPSMSFASYPNYLFNYFSIMFDKENPFPIFSTAFLLPYTQFLIFGCTLIVATFTIDDVFVAQQGFFINIILLIQSVPYGLNVSYQAMINTYMEDFKLDVHNDYAIKSFLCSSTYAGLIFYVLTWHRDSVATQFSDYIGIFLGLETVLWYYAYTVFADINMNLLITRYGACLIFEQTDIEKRQQGPFTGNFLTNIPARQRKLVLGLVTIGIFLVNVIKAEFTWLYFFNMVGNWIIYLILGAIDFIIVFFTWLITSCMKRFREHKKQEEKRRKQQKKKMEEENEKLKED